ncbi:polar amino acid transport system substrate-binding protein [Pseudomonas sp. SJZ079]|nr:polar amino acid transport system substrate-binding protein [Pseudomonas sp. SJZ079]
MAQALGMLDRAVHWLSTLILSAALAAQAEEPITLHYNERAPYLQTLDNGDIVGLTATPVTQALRRAGIAFKWEKTPSNRQIQILEKNTGVDCMVGWFKNPQRELIGNFSLPLYRDRPTIGLARFGNSRLDSGRSLEQVLQDQQLRLLIKDGYSYGELIDGLIQRFNPRRIITTAENSTMLRMLALDRVDYFFIAEEEASELINRSKFEPGDFKLIRFSNSPAGNLRHLWCSKQVSRHRLEKINRALLELSHANPSPRQP